MDLFHVRIGGAGQGEGYVGLGCRAGKLGFAPIPDETGRAGRADQQRQIMLLAQKLNTGVTL